MTDLSKELQKVNKKGEENTGATVFQSTLPYLENKKQHQQQKTVATVITTKTNKKEIQRRIKQGKSFGSPIIKNKSRFQEIVISIEMRH